MKRIWIFLMAMLCIVSFTGCDMTEEPSGPVTVIDYEFDRTYIINNDGCCVFKGLKPVSAADIENKVKGYGWKVIGMYEVQDDGRLSQKDYRETVCGGGYEDYWFESDKKGLPGNRSFYENSEVDKLLRNALATTDQTQRTRDYQQAQKIVIDDAAYVYLFQKNYQLAMNKEVKGFVFNPMLEQVFNINTMSK